MHPKCILRRAVALCDSGVRSCVVASNDLVLIDQVLKQRAAVSPLLADKIFEVFACEQAVTTGDLSLEEIQAGVIGGGGDGAIDGVFVFLNERLLAEEDETPPPADVPRGSRLLLWLVQAKREKSFTETAIDLAASSTRRLLDLEETEEDLLELYGAELVTNVSRFRRTLTTIATRNPQVEVRFSYVSRGEVSDVNSKVEKKARDLESAFAAKFTGGVGKVEFIGASELWQRSNQVRSYTLELPYTESITHGASHIALVTLRDYLGFISDEEGALRRHIFDWNVRDYEGGVEVNREIRDSLLDHSAPQFWWLNNGVTITCSRAWTVGGKVFSLDDVQIVNGLQTSHTVHEALRDLQHQEPNHPSFSGLIQVRILKTNNMEERDKVIRATNRQTKVHDASLHATDDNQRKIEAFFLEHDWFYDRRKNYYRNLGKPANRIIGIPLLAQALAAMGFSEPHSARSRPSSLLKSPSNYRKYFSTTTPLPVYLWLARQQRVVDEFLANDVHPSERTDLRFHLAMLSAAELLGSAVHNPQQLRKLSEQESHSDEDSLFSLLYLLIRERDAFSVATESSFDKIAKGPSFVPVLLRAAGHK
ncbi:AIPR protein [Streptomyces sp. ICC1]|nr:AIPR protein [Streptomyces sp. ICC4]AWZ11125.1 AIPR protein [Streptomyces sp. ICC1]